MLDKPHVLIVAWQFPPWNQVASGRMASWAAEFGKAGWNVTVVTPEKHPEPVHGPLNFDYEFPDSVEVIEVPLALSRVGIDHRQKKLLRTISSFIGFIRGGLWAIRAHRVAKKHAEQADLLVTSFGPWFVHWIGARITKRFEKLRWLADFRDLWTGRDIFDSATFHTRVIMMNFPGFERRCLKRASQLTTVSNPLAHKLEAMHETPCETIYNGFEGKAHAPELRSAGKRFDLIYTGGIYRKYYDPTPLFRVMAELRKEGFGPDSFRLHFYGQSAEFPLMREWLETHQIEDMVELHGYLSRHEIAQVQRDASALLFLAWTNEKADGILSGKLFEYFAAGRPIVSVGCSEKPAVSKLILSTRTGLVVKDERDGRLKEGLLDLIDGRSPSWFQPDGSEIDSFSRSYQARRVINVAEDLLLPDSPPTPSPNPTQV